MCEGPTMAPPLQVAYVGIYILQSSNFLKVLLYEDMDALSSAQCTWLSIKRFYDVAEGYPAEFA